MHILHGDSLNDCDVKYPRSRLVRVPFQLFRVRKVLIFGWGKGRKFYLFSSATQRTSERRKSEIVFRGRLLRLVDRTKRLLATAENDFGLSPFGLPLLAYLGAVIVFRQTSKLGFRPVVFLEVRCNCVFGCGRFRKCEQSVFTGVILVFGHTPKLHLFPAVSVFQHASKVCFQASFLLSDKHPTCVFRCWRFRSCEQSVFSSVICFRTYA